MKKLTLIAVMVLLLMACNNQHAKLTITVKNTARINRPDEPVIITRNTLASLLSTSIPDHLVPVLKDENNRNIPSQADDLNKDGQWDELFFLINLKPQETRTVRVLFVKKDEVPAYTTRSHIRFAKKNKDHTFTEVTHAKRLTSTKTENSQKYFQMEGPAWENDKVAFRNYYDARNGMDIFGKRVPYMVLDSVGIGTHSYHVLAPWGMDILKVGNSLGAGAIALEKEGHLYRVDLPEEGTYKMIVNGPLRSIFEMGFNNWKINGHSYNITHKISIWGGAQFYKSEVTVSGLTGDETLVTGIVKHCDSLTVRVPNDQYTLVATHCNQAFNGEKLGMGILVKSAEFIATAEAPENTKILESGPIENTYLVELKIRDNKPVDFYFYSGWELQNQQFKKAHYFIKVMEDDANRMAHPVIVK